MSNPELANAQKLVNSICDDFAELGYEKLPYPKVVRDANDIPELRTEENKRSFELRKFAYAPAYDKIYLKFDRVESLGKDLRINVYHELLHQVMHRMLLENGYYLAHFSHKRLVYAGSENWKIMLGNEAFLISEYFADIVVERTLMMKYGLRRTDLELFDPRVLKGWALGPIEGYLNGWVAPLAISNQDFIVIHWLIEGTEVYFHAFLGDKAATDSLDATAPRLCNQLQEIFRGLDVDTPSRTILERFRGLCGVAALEVDYDSISRDEGMSKLLGFENAKCPYITGLNLSRINDVLNNFLNEGRF
jgi:hypothetical protein